MSSVGHRLGIHPLGVDDLVPGYRGAEGLRRWARDAFSASMVGPSFVLTPTRVRSTRPRMVARRGGVPLAWHRWAGGCPAVRATAERFAADVAAVLEVEGCGDMDLVGHSMGAAVCLEAAALPAVRARRLIALDALCHLSLYAQAPAEVIPIAMQPYRDDFESTVAALVMTLVGGAAAPHCPNRSSAR